MVGEFGFVLTTVCLLVVPSSQSANVTISEQAREAIWGIKWGINYRYNIYYLTKDNVIDVESTGSNPKYSKAIYDDFLKEFDKLKNQCRYIVYNCGSTNYFDNIVFIKWSPDNADENQKILYASNYEAVKQTLDEGYKYIQMEVKASNLTDIQQAFKGNCLNSSN